MKYYLIAGEASGDLHASNLMRALKQFDKTADFRFFGGDLMALQGGTLVKHYKDTAFMGFISVVKNLKTIRANLKLCENDILQYNPDVVILVDYPGFNLRIARFAKNKGFKTFYYISPKIWAWKQSRIKTIKAFVDEMFTILPFETDFYRKFDYPVHYMGNPLLDEIAQTADQKGGFGLFMKKNNLENKPVIALLSGSRKHELKYMLPVMLKMKNHFPQFQFVIAGVPSLEEKSYAQYHYKKKATLLYNQTHTILRYAHTAVVTSGTAALETALFNVPQVVCYKGAGGRFFHLLGKLFLKIKWVSLVNLILNRPLVKELLQSNLTEENLKRELSRLLNDPSYREKMKAGYAQLREKLGEPGASERVAEKMVQLLTN